MSITSPLTSNQQKKKKNEIMSMKDHLLFMTTRNAKTVTKQLSTYKLVHNIFIFSSQFFPTETSLTYTSYIVWQIYIFFMKRNEARSLYTLKKTEMRGR